MNELCPVLSSDHPPALIRQAKSNFLPIASAAIESELIPASIYAMYLGDMESEQAEELRKFLPDPNFETVCTSDEPQKFSCTEEVRLILEYFKQKGGRLP